jgi:hypothetical protein
MSNLCPKFGTVSGLLREVSSEIHFQKGQLLRLSKEISDEELS